MELAVKGERQKQLARVPARREGLEVSVSGIRISLGRGSAMLLASAIAALIYALARSF